MRRCVHEGTLTLAFMRLRISVNQGRLPVLGIWYTLDGYASELCAIIFSRYIDGHIFSHGLRLELSDLAFHLPFIEEL